MLSCATYTWFFITLFWDLSMLIHVTVSHSFHLFSILLHEHIILWLIHSLAEEDMDCLQVFFIASNFLMHFLAHLLKHKKQAFYDTYLEMDFLFVLKNMNIFSFTINIVKFLSKMVIQFYICTSTIWEYLMFQCKLLPF